MPAYEAGGFDPPVPVVRATVRGPEGTVQNDVPMVIDTGADVSLIPLGVAQAVEAATQPSSAPIRFLEGEPISVPQADLCLEFLGYRFRGPFLLLDSTYGILGRNVLNLMIVTLDGPSLTWSV